MKIIKTDIPPDSLTQRFLPVDYTDAFACKPETVVGLSADDIQVTLWTAMPGWLNALFKIRDIIVRPFGLEGGNGKERYKDFKEMLYDGKSMKIMSVAAKAENETVLKLDDKHLEAYMSVYVDQATITVITLVRYHNLLGKTYFFFVKPFHKIVVKNMLKYTLRICLS